ncbi:MAG: hypothetical protein V7647_3003 [Acidobacteriota bacterium]|jgi:hypothetical protein
MSIGSRWIVLSTALAACALAGGMSIDGSEAAPARGLPASLRPGLSSPAPAPAPATGRYKKSGSACVWDAKDSGPNQCTPLAEGRFRRDGRACVWDAAGRGPNQCRPTTGRFKKEGDACVWNATDTGRNQCNPRQPK